MYRNWASDQEVTRYLTWNAHTSVEVTKQILTSWTESYSDPANYQWAIELKEIGEPIGSIAAVEMNENTEAATIGYCIGRKWWGQGIGRRLFEKAEKAVSAETEFILLSTATKNWEAIFHFYLDELGMEFWSSRLFKKV